MKKVFFVFAVLLVTKPGWAQLSDDNDEAIPGPGHIVNGVNEPPVITGSARELSMDEDSTLELALTDLTVTDSDNVWPDDFTLIVYAGDNYTVNGYVITPAADYYGELLVRVSVSDGENESAVFDLPVAVNPVNDVPVITGPASQLSIDEDTSLQLTLNDVTVTDPDNIYPDDFTLIVYAGDNYLVSGVVVTPAENFYGELIIPVSVSDGMDESTTFDLSVLVNSVNDVPVITGAASQLSVDEDTSLQLTLDDLTVTDPDNSWPDDFTLVIGDGSNYSVSGDQVTPATDFYGELTVPVSVTDGTDKSDAFNLLVSVEAVNDAPVITGTTAELITTEGKSLELSSDRFSITDPDNNPGDFILTVYPGTSYSVDGMIITPDVGFTGDLTVPVSVSDGLIESMVFEALVQVTPVTGFEEKPTDQNFVVYPNPAYDRLNIHFESEEFGPVRVELLRTDGKVASSHTFLKKAAEFSGVIDLGGRARGLYLLRITRDNGLVRTTRILVH